MKVRLLKISCLLLCLTLLSGCWQAEPDTPDIDDLMTEEDPAPIVQTDVILPTDFRLPYSPDQMLDPITCPDGMQQVVTALLYEGLFELNEQLEPQPLLCTGITVSEDPLICTLQLRQDVLFSDGSPLTAQDVAQSLKRAAASARYGARFRRVSSITVQEDQVVLTLSSANAALASLLDIPIVKAGTENTLVPIGTGPYTLSPTEESAQLQKNIGWWQKKQLPVDTIELLPAGDRDTMLYQFTSRDTQLITADLTGTAPVSVTGSIGFHDADTTILQYVGFNTTRTPFNSANLRMALEKGVNREFVVSATLSGHGQSTRFPISPVSPLYPSQLENTYSYDAFATAMTEAGWNDGETQTVTLLVNSENSFKRSAAESIADSLSAFDLKVKVLALPWEEYTAALAAGNFDLYYGEVKLTADWDLAPLLASGGSLNYSGWSNVRTDQLLATLRTSAPENRAENAELLCSHLLQTTPILPVCFKSTTVLVQSGAIEDLSPTAANPFHDFSSCTIHLQS